jgi:alkanesulfonate monooxygenase SsuD/methylene tetrahydromethanopterin reductase-like flavin-dependent oxidoreductase (luciferase family)
VRQSRDYYRRGVARTKNIRLGPLVFVLPLWNPLRVAEEVAMLDNLTRGRLECGFGSGLGRSRFPLMASHGMKSEK